MSKVLILGATSDMAVAIAKKFASEGYSLILAARSLTKLEPLQKDMAIRFPDVGVESLAFDALDFASHQPFVDQLVQGGLPEVSVCVFGYLGDQEKAQQDWNEAMQIIGTNYTGAASVMDRLAEAYEKKGSGCLIGISSVAGERGRQSNYFYGSAKAAFSAYLSGLRNRMAKKNVHVVTVKPGFVNTKMIEGMDTPKPLTAQPEEVAKTVYSAYKKEKNIVYTKSVWRPLMYAIKSIPESMFKKLKL
ncbi:SDR family oxidoreductase [Roseivirga sp. BDSF3-8]|uniref:SDR family oxidoreductase n=1 Tax=Roseivirga sp. BDSF3-8 TaxID=3241598 RepID=UPI003532212F